MSKINKPKLYNTGFLRDDSLSRMKQGLLPQDISSLCYIFRNPKPLEKNPYFNNVMFPIKGLEPYNGTPIDARCPCASNLYGQLGYNST